MGLIILIGWQIGKYQQGQIGGPGGPSWNIFTQQLWPVSDRATPGAVRDRPEREWLWLGE